MIGDYVWVAVPGSMRRVVRGQRAEGHGGRCFGGRRDGPAETRSRASAGGWWRAVGHRVAYESGRRFQEHPDLETAVLTERPVEADNKVYWIPHNSIRYAEIIAPGSASERLDNEIQRHKVFTPQELHRPTES